MSRLGRASASRPRLAHSRRWIGDALTLGDIAPDRVVGHGFAAAGEAREEIVDPEDLDGHGGCRAESLQRRDREARRGRRCRSAQPLLDLSRSDVAAAQGGQEIVRRLEAEVPRRGRHIDLSQPQATALAFQDGASLGQVSVVVAYFEPVPHLGSRRCGL
jgi:hypothetical protein